MVTLPALPIQLVCQYRQAVTSYVTLEPKSVVIPSMFPGNAPRGPLRLDGVGGVCERVRAPRHAGERRAIPRRATTPPRCARPAPHHTDSAV